MDIFMRTVISICSTIRLIILASLEVFEKLEVSLMGFLKEGPNSNVKLYYTNI